MGVPSYVAQILELAMRVQWCIHKIEFRCVTLAAVAYMSQMVFLLNVPVTHVDG